MPADAGARDVLGLDRATSRTSTSCPANQELVDYFAAVQDEIEQRVADGVAAVADERYRLYFDGIMNWNKLGLLSRKFAEHDVAVVAGRYTHHAFWQEPQLIDPADDPLLGHGAALPALPDQPRHQDDRDLMLRDCDDYDVDGIVFHSTRTCRAFTNPQRLMAKAAQEKLGVSRRCSSRGTSPTRRSTRTRSWRAGWPRCSRGSTCAGPRA